MLKYPEQFREAAAGAESSPGSPARFRVPLPVFSSTACVQAALVEGWEHVSVYVVENGKEETPTWEEMRAVRALFWDPDDCVLQYYPAEGSGVDRQLHTIHLWRPIGNEVPTPPKAAS